MKAGKLTERVDIERAGGATNENGEALPDSWVLHARVWADVEFINGVKHVVSGATRSSAVASVRVRYRADMRSRGRASGKAMADTTRMARLRLLSWCSM